MSNRLSVETVTGKGEIHGKGTYRLTTAPDLLDMH